MVSSARTTSQSLSDDKSVATSSSRWWLCCLGGTGSKKYSLSRSSRSLPSRKVSMGPSSIKLRQKQLKKMQDLRNCNAVAKKPISKILMRNDQQDRTPKATYPTSYEQMRVSGIGSGRLRSKLSVSTVIDSNLEHSWSSPKIISPDMVTPRKANVPSIRRKKIIINMHAEADTSTREKAEYSANVSMSTSSTSHSTSRTLSSSVNEA
mmetsp:Transcript_19728/g.27771  ORF Transcript_19728/g.27771 Transcript_19728/m.27771 type:complete len:207 (+) Transcript_19728:39-659(+)